MDGTTLVTKIQRPMRWVALVLLVVAVASGLAGNTSDLVRIVTRAALLAGLWLAGIAPLGKPCAGASSLEHVCCACTYLHYALATAAPVCIVAYVVLECSGAAGASFLAMAVAALATIAHIGTGLLARTLKAKVDNLGT